MLRWSESLANVVTEIGFDEITSCRLEIVDIDDGIEHLVSATEIASDVDMCDHMCSVLASLPTRLAHSFTSARITVPIRVEV